MASKVHELLIKIAGKLDPRFERATKSASKGMKSLNNEARNARVFQTAARYVASLAAAYVSLRTVKESVEKAMEWQKGLASTATLTGDSVSAFTKKYEKDMRRLAVSTGISHKDINAGMNQIISTFGETPDTMGIFKVATKAARAVDALPDDVINMLGITMRNFGDISEETANKIMDMTFQTVNYGVTTVPELVASLGSCAPLFKGLSLSMEELFAATATLTGTTGNTSEVMTQLGSIVTSVVKPNKNMTQAFKKMGYSSAFAAFETLGLNGALQKLYKHVGKNKVAFQQMFGRKEAMTAVLPLVTTQAETFTTRIKDMKNSLGVTDKAF